MVTRLSRGKDEEDEESDAVGEFKVTMVTRLSRGKDEEDEESDVVSEFKVR